jgi:hypothetical protein
MTDLLDPPISKAVGREPAAAAPSGPSTRMADRWLLAWLLFGAAAIHFVMAPSHIGQSSVEGSGFVVAGWAQVGLAVAVLVWPRRRGLLLAAVLLSVGLIGAWIVSRTAGLPFGAHEGHPETVGFVDGAAVVLEVLAAVVGLALLVDTGRGLVRSAGAAAIGVTGALVLTTAALASPSARDHAAHSHGDHGVAGDGHDHEAAEDDLGFAALSNGHQHEHGSDEPLTVGETVTLASQLAATTPLVQQYPTLADAEAGGWRRAGPFSPGLGVHYQGPAFSLNPDGRMDPEDLAAPMLIYDGIDPESRLAGFMYLAYGSSGEPEGFAGPNDHWHYHEHVCIRYGADGSIETPFGADLPGLTQDMCTDVGGTWIDYTGYMVHVWNVPGYESPDGMFTELNPKITCPDGTYRTIPTEEIGERATTCRTT